MPPEMNDQGIQIKPNIKLSDIDKAFATINYPFFVSHDPTILNYWSQGDWEQIRYAFTGWCTSTRMARRPAQGMNPNPEETSLPDGFDDGCLQEVIDRGIRHLSSEGNGAAQGVDYLWTPDQDVTYAFLQGTGQATPYRKKRVADTFSIRNARANLVVKEVPWGPILQNLISVYGLARYDGSTFLAGA